MLIEGVSHQPTLEKLGDGFHRGTRSREVKLGKKLPHASCQNGSN